MVRCVFLPVLALIRARRKKLKASYNLFRTRIDWCVLICLLSPSHLSASNCFWHQFFFLSGGAAHISLISNIMRQLVLTESDVKEAEMFFLMPFATYSDRIWIEMSLGGLHISFSCCHLRWGWYKTWHFFHHRQSEEAFAVYNSRMLWGRKGRGDDEKKRALKSFQERVGEWRRILLCWL